MTPFSMFLALQPTLSGLWSLSNTATGWISGAYFTGYMLGVPLLSSLTDRRDARGVWLVSCVIAGVAALGFAALADGIWSAAVFQALAGVGLAGSYMPGLKVIADRLQSAVRPRDVAFYTTSFTIGSSLSFWAMGALGDHFSWRTAVTIAAAGPLMASTLVALALRPALAAHAPASAARHWNSVIQSNDSLRYVAGYAVHVWELFALRAWVVPFVVYVTSTRGDPPIAAATLAAIVGLIGVPASIAGAELTSTFRRRRVIASVMLLSAGVSLLVTASLQASWAVVIAIVCLYSALISADSAALTSGILDVAPPASRGTAMAVYSTVGFAAAAAGTFAVGALLDLLGGQNFVNWTLAFALMGAPNLLGAVIVAKARR